MNQHNLSPTAILDYEHPIVRQAVDCITVSSQRGYLQQAYQYVADHVQPIYTVDEFQPVSETLSKGMGACSQRIACVEAIARAGGIPTRIHALWITGKFWHPRFPRWTYPFIPKRILLLWAQFYMDDQWLDFSEVVASLTKLLNFADSGFNNSAETLFDAVAMRPVDFENRLKSCECGDRYDLSSYVVVDGGIFATRDEALRQFGSFQTTWRGYAFELIFGGKRSWKPDFSNINPVAPEILQEYQG